MFSNFDFRSFFTSDDNLFVKYVFRKNLLQTSSAGINYLEKHNLEIAPHGKTTMAPQIYADQIKYGAWGITAGAINQIQVMFDYGINKVLLANQLLGKSHLETIASYINQNKKFSFYCFF